MTSPNDTKPSGEVSAREWTLNGWDGPADSVDASSPVQLCKHESVTVVEKSEYDKLRRERDELRMLYNQGLKYLDERNAEVDRLKGENEELKKKVLEFRRSMSTNGQRKQEEIDTLRAEVERLEDENHKLKHDDPYFEDNVSLVENLASAREELERSKHGCEQLMLRANEVFLAERARVEKLRAFVEKIGMSPSQYGPHTAAVARETLADAGDLK